MKKLYKERNLYFLLTQPYPENLYLKGFPIWTNKRLLPEFEKPLEKTIKHLKKKLFKNPVFFKNSNLLKKKQYPLFTFGQADIHVRSPRTLYRKVSYFYKSLVEKKKYHIIYGISNQKKLIKDLAPMGNFCFSFLEKKIDVIFFKTGMFQSLAEVQKDINHGKLYWNGEKILSFSIRGQPGDFFQLQKPEKKNPFSEKKEERDFIQKKDRTVPKRLLFTPSFFQYKKIILTFKKIMFYNYLSNYKKKSYRNNLVSKKS